MEARVAQELIDFYVDSLDREEITCFFERQAATMRIIDKYVREGAADQVCAKTVNISGKCREKLLSTDVTEYEIFDQARAEVLSVMEMNFQREFVKTDEFQRIAVESVEQEMDMELLGAKGLSRPLSAPGSLKYSQSFALPKLKMSTTIKLKDTKDSKCNRGGGIGGESGEGGGGHSGRGDSGRNTAVVRKLTDQNAGDQGHVLRYDDRVGRSIDDLKRAATTGQISTAGSRMNSRHSNSCVNDNSRGAGEGIIRQQQGKADPSEEHRRNDRPGHFFRRVAAAAVTKVKQATIVPQ
ncbi:unnamed protein product [Sphacelaria rigidula]